LPTLDFNAYTQFSRETLFVISTFAIKANPYWFGHDIYSPKTIEEGGPFTIGRVIHSNRHATLSAYIGGVAVFNRALTAEEIKNLSEIGQAK
jgi:hypothetical protein